MRSNYPADIRKGLILLEQLIKHEASDEDAKRNYLYYLALGNSRIKVSIIFQLIVCSLICRGNTFFWVPLNLLFKYLYNYF